MAQSTQPDCNRIAAQLSRWHLMVAAGRDARRSADGATQGPGAEARQLHFHC